MDNRNDKAKEILVGVVVLIVVGLGLLQLADGALTEVMCGNTLVLGGLLFFVAVRIDELKQQNTDTQKLLKHLIRMQYEKNQQDSIRSAEVKEKPPYG